MKDAVTTTKNLAKKRYTEEEKQRLARYEARAHTKPVKFKAGSNAKKVQITIENLDDPLLDVKMSEAFGTTDIDVQGHFLDQVVRTFGGTFSVDGHCNPAIAGAANQALAILAGVQPQNELEAMLVIQMIGVHNMAIDTLRRAMTSGQTFAGKRANVNQATKMLRTYMAQMEVLKRYRTAGQQRTAVGHVQVNEGGQAIVGTVNQGRG
jgi:hypothetical protein